MNDTKQRDQAARQAATRSNQLAERLKAIDGPTTTPRREAFRADPKIRRPAQSAEHGAADMGVGQGYGYDAAADQSRSSHHVAAGTNIHIDQRGSMYRPMKEEMKLAAFHVGLGFLTWPFRLIGRIVEGIIGGIGGIARIAITVVVLPLLLVIGMSFASSHRNADGHKIGHDIGSGVMHAIASVAGGAWDAVTGRDEAPAAPAPRKGR